LLKKFEKLENLANEKKQRIINAALNEFADHDYDNASTNRIVEAADIGKGMLFYYFHSKKDLYYYLVDYSLDIVTEEFLNHIDESITNFLERLKHISQIKLTYFWEYPEVNHFMGTHLLQESTNLPEDLNKKLEKAIASGNEKMYHAHPETTTNIRDDIDAEKAAQLMEWALIGYQQDTLQRFKGQNMKDIDLDQLWDEFDDYLDILQTVFYDDSSEREEI